MTCPAATRRASHRAATCRETRSAYSFSATAPATTRTTRSATPARSRSRSWRRRLTPAPPREPQHHDAADEKAPEGRPDAERLDLRGNHDEGQDRSDAVL